MKDVESRGMPRGRRSINDGARTRYGYERSLKSVRFPGMALL
jgi:hypothetical protein